MVKAMMDLVEPMLQGSVKHDKTRKVLVNLSGTDGDMKVKPANTTKIIFDGHVHAR